MTKAEELYLKKLTAAVHAQEAAEVENTIISKPEEKPEKKPEFDPEMNPRLQKERNPITDKLAVFFKKKTMT